MVTIINLICFLLRNVLTEFVSRVIFRAPNPNKFSDLLKSQTHKPSRFADYLKIQTSKTNPRKCRLANIANRKFKYVWASESKTNWENQ
jgi:hypothetical protein